MGEQAYEPPISLSEICSRRCERLWIVAFKDDQSLKEGIV